MFIFEKDFYLPPYKVSPCTAAFLTVKAEYGMGWKPDFALLLERKKEQIVVGNK